MKLHFSSYTGIRFALMSLIAATCFAGACGTSSERCIPGDVKACPCLSGLKGAQSCDDSGHHWNACDCPDTGSSGIGGAGAGGSGGAKASTGAGGSSCSSSSCNDHGSCSDNVCTCSEGYAGATCGLCAPGYTGYPDCVPNCPLGFCNGHGTCSDNVCTCDVGYGGVYCEMCAPGYLGYPDCPLVCPPNFCNDHGSCTNNLCDCATGYAGFYCNTCASGYTDYPNCTLQVCMPNSTSTCYSGPPGTLGIGACVAGTKTCNPQGTGYGSCVGEVTPAVESCATPQDENCKIDCGEHLWSQRFGKVNTQTASGIAIDASANIMLTGQFGGTINLGGTDLFSAGASDLFLAKFNSSGVHSWSKSFNCNATKSYSSIASDAVANIAMVGYFTGTVNLGGATFSSTGGSYEDIFVAKFDSAGNHLWSKRFGDGVDQQARTVAFDKLSNIVVGGHLFGSIDLGGGNLFSSGFDDIFIAKFDTNGNHIWSKRFGDNQEQYTEALAIDANNNIIVTGEMYGTLDFGVGALVGAGARDIFLAKLDASGNAIWSRRFGDESEQYAYGVAVDPSGNVIITGRLDGSANFGGGLLVGAGGGDLFVAKFAPNGAHLWSKRFGDALFQAGLSLTTDSAGNILLTGVVEGTVDFGFGPITAGCVRDVFIAKFDPNGNTLWGKVFAPSCGVGSAIATDSLNAPILAGNFSTIVNFGGGQTMNVTNRDVFLAKFVP